VSRWTHQIEKKLANHRSSNLGSAFRSWSFGGAEFPEDLAEDAEGEFGVGGGKL
jgi:hypothetical protein